MSALLGRIARRGCPFPSVVQSPTPSLFLSSFEDSFKAREGSRLPIPQVKARQKITAFNPCSVTVFEAFARLIVPVTCLGSSCAPRGLALPNWTIPAIACALTLTHLRSSCFRDGNGGGKGDSRERQFSRLQVLCF